MRWIPNAQKMVNCSLTVDNIEFVEKSKGIKTWNFVHSETVFLNDDLQNSNIENENELTEHEEVTAMESLPDLEILVTGNKNGVVKFWKLGGKDEITGQNYLRDHKLHNGKVLSITYLSSDFKRFIFTGGEDSVLCMISVSDSNEWEVKKFNRFPTNRVTNSGPVTGEINSICNGFNGKHVYYSIGSKISVFNMIVNEIVNIQEFQQEIIHSMIYVKELALLIYSTDFAIKAISPEDSDRQFTMALEFPLTNLIACQANNQHHFIGNYVNSGKLVHFTVVNDEFVKVKSYEIPGSIVKLFYCFDRRTFAATMKEGFFFLVNIEKESVKKRSHYDQTPFTNGAYLGDGRTICVSTIDAKLDFFNCS